MKKLVKGMNKLCVYIGSNTARRGEVSRAKRLKKHFG